MMLVEATTTTMVSNMVVIGFPRFPHWQMLTKFRRGSDALAEIHESVSFQEEDSLSSTLNVFTKYMEAARDMLYKRIGLLVE